MPTFKTSRKGTAPTYAFGKKGKSVVKVICIPVCFKNFANIRRDCEFQVNNRKKIGGFCWIGDSVYLVIRWIRFIWQFGIFKRPKTPEEFWAQPAKDQRLKTKDYPNTPTRQPPNTLTQLLLLPIDHFRALVFIFDRHGFVNADDFDLRSTVVLVLFF